jgi:uncharacterized protein
VQPYACGAAAYDFAGLGAYHQRCLVAAFAPGVAGHTLYPAAKSFVIKFSQSVDCEVRKKGIHVTPVCPGYTLTENHAASGMADLVSQRPRRFGADPAAVVAEALTANARGRVVVVTGVRNRVRRLGLKMLPESVTRPIINMVAARFRRDALLAAPSELAVDPKPAMCSVSPCANSAQQRLTH